jgi:hypothetical protein
MVVMSLVTAPALRRQFLLYAPAVHSGTAAPSGPRAEALGRVFAALAASSVLQATPSTAGSGALADTCAWVGAWVGGWVGGCVGAWVGGKSGSTGPPFHLGFVRLGCAYPLPAGGLLACNQGNMGVSRKQMVPLLLELLAAEHTDV